MEKVYDYLTKSNCHHVLAILDSCYSGAFLWATEGRKGTVVRSKFYKEHLQRFKNQKTQLLMYSAAYNQEASDGHRGASKESGNSPFAAALIDVNFRSAALWCMAAANHFEAERAGTLAVIGSVAGDRGRQSNYLYGATKAGLAVLVQGLAHRLAAVGARAVLVKPGFVDTAMTAHIPNKGALWSSPDKIGGLIRKAAASGKPVSYAPGYWRLIMTVIKSVPTPVFHRTKL